VQLAWIELDVPQCGYCQSGMDHERRGAAEQTPKSDRYGIDAEITNACRLQHLPPRRKAIRLPPPDFGGREDSMMINNDLTKPNLFGVIFCPTLRPNWALSLFSF